VPETPLSHFERLIERVRHARPVSRAFDKDAARYGTTALSQISKETEQRPLIAIAVALGVGILIGMVASGRSR
jgi:ElaB/YqjD/DUF883 family membrane-anchored ribosome-binding protein